MASTRNPPGKAALATLSTDALDSFRAAFRGTLFLPDSEGYDEARTVWNGMVNKFPAIIACCTGTADVVSAVQFATEHDLELAVRGGGHNVAGTAVSDGGLVVDLSPMNGVWVGPERERVWVQGGATLGDVDRETQLFGRSTPLGVVSKTGVAGLTLNGGVGHLRRQHGLACDNLRSATVVTADGQVRHASEHSHEDLFWAIRGGGGNLGVVTSFEFALHDVGPEVFGLFVVHHGEHTVEAMDRFREYVDSASRASSVVPFVGHVPELPEFPEDEWGEPMVAFLGCYDGDMDAARETFSPLRDVADPAAGPIADFSEPMPYTALQTMLDEDYPDGLHYYWKATYLTALTDEIVELVDRRGKASPSPLSTVDIWHLGGAIAEVDQRETAFWHRDKPYMLTFEANWEDPIDDDENVAWVRESLEEVQEMDVAAGSYGNFPGFHEDPAQAMFGDNYDRLVEVKTEYDPENRFHLNQNVEPRTE